MNVSPQLTGVSAASRDAAWIVGAPIAPGQRAVAWHWDGNAWQSVPLPTGAHATLNSVVTVSPDDAWGRLSRVD
jgi:hypothetical protein